MKMESLTRVDIKFECHNKTAPSVVAGIANAVSTSGLPMRVDVKRVPIGGDLNNCRIIVKGEAFNFAGVKLVREAVKQGKLLA
jgi:hypothetical protein